MARKRFSWIVMSKLWRFIQQPEEIWHLHEWMNMHSNHWSSCMLENFAHCLMIIHRAISTSERFFRSVTPFWNGVYAVVNCCWMPFCFRNLTNSAIFSSLIRYNALRRQPSYPTSSPDYTEWNIGCSHRLAIESNDDRQVWVQVCRSKPTLPSTSAVLPWGMPTMAIFPSKQGSHETFTEQLRILMPVAKLLRFGSRKAWG